MREVSGRSSFLGACGKNSRAFTDSMGPGYAPYVIVGFSEAIDVSTVTAATLFLTQENGAAIPVTVAYSGMTGEAVALAGEAIARFVLEGRQQDYSFALRDLRINQEGDCVGFTESRV